MRIRDITAKAALSLAAAFLMLSGPAWAEAEQPFLARVVHVADGDTIEVVRQGDKMELHKIRLYGLDAPESGQAYGKRAAQYLRQMINKKIVTIEVMQQSDRYGRVVGIVRAEDGQDAGLELILAGYAWVYPQYCRRADICDGYRAAEGRARAAKVGLWQDKEPVPPWEWRK